MRCGWAGSAGRLLAVLLVRWEMGAAPQGYREHVPPPAEHSAASPHRMRRHRKQRRQGQAPVYGAWGRGVAK